MKNILLATVMLLGIAGVAQAQSADPLNADRSGLYVGGNIGTSNDQQNRINLGGAVGYQVAPWARVEAAYDHAWRTQGVGNTLMGNAIGQYRIPNTTVTPYVLVGAGIGFDKFGAVGTGNATGVYNVGAGVRLAVSQSVELDARYRRVAPLGNDKMNSREQNLFTVGAAYRF